MKGNVKFFFIFRPSPSFFCQRCFFRVFFKSIFAQIITKNMVVFGDIRRTGNFCFTSRALHRIDVLILKEDTEVEMITSLRFLLFLKLVPMALLFSLAWKAS